MRPNKKQIDEIVSLVTILNSTEVPEDKKMLAQMRLQAIKDEITSSQYGVSKDRISDVQHLERVLKDPTATVWHKRQAEQVLKKILSENSAVKSMRKSLIKEMKAGRSENVLDINDYVSKHSHLQ